MGYAGDRGAALFLVLPPARPNLGVLRVTPHIGRGLAQQLVALTRANHRPAAKRKKGGGQGGGTAKA
jgi:hypothetical protein